MLHGEAIDSTFCMQQGTEPRLVLPSVNRYLRRLQHEYLDRQQLMQLGDGPGYYTEASYASCHVDSTRRRLKRWSSQEGLVAALFHLPSPLLHTGGELGCRGPKTVAKPIAFMASKFSCRVQEGRWEITANGPAVVTCIRHHISREECNCDGGRVD